MAIASRTQRPSVSRWRQLALDAGPNPGPNPGRSPGPDNALNRVLGVLGPAPVDVDEIVRATGLAVRDVRGILLELALGGHGGRPAKDFRPAVVVTLL